MSVIARLEVLPTRERNMSDAIERELGRPARRDADAARSRGSRGRESRYLTGATPR